MQIMELTANMITSSDVTERDLRGDYFYRPCVVRISSE